MKIQICFQSLELHIKNSGFFIKSTLLKELNFSCTYQAIDSNTTVLCQNCTYIRIIKQLGTDVWQHYIISCALLVTATRQQNNKLMRLPAAASSLKTKTIFTCWQHSSHQELAPQCLAALQHYFISCITALAALWHQLHYSITALAALQPQLHYSIS